jgi:hypothetical protein
MIKVTIIELFFLKITLMEVVSIEKYQIEGRQTKKNQKYKYIG